MKKELMTATSNIEMIISTLELAIEYLDEFPNNQRKNCLIDTLSLLKNNLRRNTRTLEILIDETV